MTADSGSPVEARSQSNDSGIPSASKAMTGEVVIRPSSRDDSEITPL